MLDVQFSGGATALAERPGEGKDEFALDVRVVIAYGPVMGDCPTDDGCGNTCQGNASACTVRAVDLRLETLNIRESQLHTMLAEAATDGPKLLELDAELRALLAERGRVEEQWLLAAETAEG